MQIDRLELRNFRNYASEDIWFPGGTTLLVGENGQGKTNLVEAVYYLAHARSWRSADDAVLTGEAGPTSTIGADIQNLSLGPVRIDLAIGEGARTLRNQKPLKSRRELAGTFRAVLFAPEDLELVKGAPGARRQFLDDLMGQLRPALAAVRADFERVLRQRNGLLRSASGRLSETRTLDVWDASMAEKGAAMVCARRELVASLAPFAAGAHGEVARPRAGAEVADTLEVAYRCSFSEREDAPQVADDLLRALASARPDEIRRGMTLAGPQRDDLRVCLGPRDARTRASQGEQRTAALALRLGEMRCIEQSTGEAPVLLLDDVFSELDPGRSERLVAGLAGLGGIQAIVTSAGVLPERVQDQAVARLRVTAGRVEACP